jgi:hypothetical protein
VQIAGWAMNGDRVGDQLLGDLGGLRAATVQPTT